MSYFLIYCYVNNEYRLTNENEPGLNCEVLYQFDGTELKIAQKILNNLTKQDENQKETDKIRGERVAA